MYSGKQVGSDGVWSQPVGNGEDKGDKGDKEESSFQPTTDDHTRSDGSEGERVYPLQFKPVVFYRNPASINWRLALISTYRESPQVSA